MMHRERVMKALNHEEPDRIPIDIGGTLCTGIMAVAYDRLKKHLGIDGKPIKLSDTGQQLAWIDDEILEYFDADVKPIHRLVDWLGMRLDEWEKGELTDGSEALVPKGFNPVKEGNYFRILESGENPSFRISAGLTPHKGRFLGGKSPLTSSKHGFFGPFPPQNQIRQSPVR